jgi:hypothetical protein
MIARRSVPRRPDQISILEPPAPESTWTEEELCDELWRIQKKFRGRDAAILEAAILELKALSSLRGDLDILEHDLDEADKFHEAPELIDDPDARGKIELVAGAISVNVVRSFLLSLLHRSRSLDLLEKALTDLLESGIVPAMLYPLEHFAHRPPDPNSIVAYKGAIAGMMHAQLRAGMSRKEAAEFLARNVAPRLAGQLSRKPLTARMIVEWLDRYGGKSGEEGVGRKFYKTWSQGEPVSPQKCREITERMAKTLPARKPS